MQTIQHAASHSVRPLSRLDAQPRRSAGRLFNLKVLSTPDERIAIAGLRKYAPIGVEDDLGAGLMQYEALRDDVGFVTALYQEEKLVATMRFVPSGLRMTAAERIGPSIASLPAVASPGSWEVGRLIVAPDERSPDLLGRCLGLSLRALARHNEIAHFYAIAGMTMARLWRRFGMHPIAPLTGASGAKFFLVSGSLARVASALDVPLTALQLDERMVDKEPPFATFAAAKRRVVAAGSRAN